MSLKDLEIKKAYDSDEDDLVTDFYMPVLSRAIKYYRRSGFFSSSSLAVSARGIGDLIRKDGEMKLICNVHLSKEDHDILKKAHEDPTKFLEESNIAIDLRNIEDEIEKDHVEALGWMLAKGLLEIKIAFPQNNIGVYHPKVGVFIDGEGNYISFSGSENESFTGMVFNVEEFKTFKSWEDWDKDRALFDLRKFENEWIGNTKKTVVVDLPKAIKKKLIKCVPHEKADLALLKKNYPSIYKNIKKPLPARDYQCDAVVKWFNNGCKGILNMATGSGKTITALNCFETLKNKKTNFLTIVACPQQHLVTQWEENFKEFFNHKILVTVGNNKWDQQLKFLIGDMLLGSVDFPIVLTTHVNLASDKFKKILGKWNLDVLIIVDEVHGIGSTKQKGALLPKYKYRLGLSATPSRWFDDEGTKFIDDYFSGQVFEYGLERAIKDGFLTKYYYCPHFVELNDSELSEYMELTKKIAIKYSKNKNLEDIVSTSDFIKRQAIVDNAKSKFEEFEKILMKNEKWDHLLVYCASKHVDNLKQLNKVEEILSNNHIVPQQFTSRQTMEKRKIILDKFKNGDCKALTAMKCLDEGVDVPAAKTAILMASDSNPRQHIQRRGRILRKSPGKEYAIIHDMVVLPKFHSNLSEAEKTLINKELQRFEEFMELAENFDECNEKYMEWRGI